MSISTNPLRSVSTISNDGASPSTTSSRTITSTVIVLSDSGVAAAAEPLTWMVAATSAMVSAGVIGERILPTTDPARAC